MLRNFEERKAEIFRRSEKRIKERRQKRNGILAAGVPICLVLVVLSITSFSVHFLTKQKNAAPEDVNDNDMACGSYLDGCEERTVKFISQYIRTDGYHENVEYPVVKIIHSVDELMAYYDANKGSDNLEHDDELYSVTTDSFFDAFDRYDEAYFENQILVMVILEEGSGSIRHKVDTVKVGTDGKLHISICTIIPECGTCDMAQWHILIEPENGVDVANETEVIIDIYAEYQ